MFIDLSNTPTCIPRVLDKIIAVKYVTNNFKNVPFKKNFKNGGIMKNLVCIVLENKLP